MTDEIRAVRNVNTIIHLVSINECTKYTFSNLSHSKCVQTNVFQMETLLQKVYDNGLNC